MANHGIMVAGASVAEAFNDLYYLERAAMFQVLAKSTGGKLKMISDRVREQVKEQYAEERAKVAERHFTALRRILDREAPEYRN